MVNGDCSLNNMIKSITSGYKNPYEKSYKMGHVGMSHAVVCPGALSVHCLLVGIIICHTVMIHFEHAFLALSAMVGAFWFVGVTFQTPSSPFSFQWFEIERRTPSRRDYRQVIRKVSHKQTEAEPDQLITVIVMGDQYLQKRAKAANGNNHQWDLG